MSVAAGIAQPCVAPIDGGIDRRRHRHAADRSRHRQCHLRRPRQFALDQLALDLETDQQEEDRHQPVVDPQQQRLAEADAPVVDGELAAEQTLDRRVQRRIGENQGQDGGGQQWQGRCRLAVDEGLEAVRGHVISFPDSKTPGPLDPGALMDFRYSVSRATDP
jgi:hypothetical protein